MIPYGPVWSPIALSSPVRYQILADIESFVFLFKLRLGALIPRSVGQSVCLSVLQKLQKKFKTLQNFQLTHSVKGG